VHLAVVARIEAPRHAQHDPRPAVGQHQQIVRRRIDGQPLDFARTAEIGHRAERKHRGIRFSVAQIRNVEVIRLIEVGVPVVRRDQHASADHENPLLPLGYGTQVDLADIPPRFPIVAVDVASVDPVGHPDHVAVAVHRQPAHLDLPRRGFPVDRAFPFQCVSVVDRHLDILPAAVVEGFDPGVNLPVPHVDVADVVGSQRQPLERPLVFGRQPPLLVVFIERRAARHIVKIRIGGDTLPSLDGNHTFQPVLRPQILRPERHSGRQQRRQHQNSFHNGIVLCGLRQKQGRSVPDVESAPARVQSGVPPIFSSRAAGPPADASAPRSAAGISISCLSTSSRRSPA